MENVHIFKKHGKWILSEGGAVVHASADFKEISEMVLKHEKPAPIPVPEVREYDSMEDAIAEED